MKNEIIIAKSIISIPDDAIINEDNITIGGKIFKDISISISQYENNTCVDAEILETNINIQEINSDKTFQELIQKSLYYL